MIYIFNTHLKSDKTVLIALMRLTGIGKRMSTQICDQLGLSAKMRLDCLSPFQIDALNQMIHQSYLTQVELRLLVRKNKNRLCSISSYRGFRHLEGLPCRGQRTHGNARTSRKSKQNAFLKPKQSKQQA